ncbi:sulfonate ABC transporter permease [Desulfosarcina ovata subsp. sediminis]|uniref:Sulfonate ABC transporter permease n=1 Tax=Desulfosarcina ovata subsp. sediminis TaxID=885957 RepID=A0A5K7ZG43_9BACT|nr:ABC transporter permease [Desulfosarcina ovata]BBO79881.1 sulfonate ABC transporter permease [Desulfosarcina ovata subsp. sediminis]
MGVLQGSKKGNSPYTWLIPFAGFALLVLAWALLSRFSGWSRQVFPGPLTVLISMAELVADGTLIRHTVASLYRVTIGFYLAAGLGIPLGIALGMTKGLRALVNPLIQFLRPISPLAWIPLAMLWFGIGDPPAIFLIFLSSFFPLVVSTTIAVDGINPTYFHVAANFNFSLFETVARLIIPAIVPEVITALRMTVTISWLVVVAAEMIAVQSGLGFLILDARNALRMDYVMDGMVVIGLVGLALDRLMRKLGRLEEVSWHKMSH